MTRGIIPFLPFGKRFIRFDVAEVRQALEKFKVRPKAKGAEWRNQAVGGRRRPKTSPRAYTAARNHMSMMTPLDAAFRFGGFDFVQIAREGDVALFRKSKQHAPEFVFETYEVVIVQKMDEHQWPNGDTTPAHEHMPAGERWGAAGWSLQTLDRGWEKFREVINGKIQGSERQAKERTP